MNAKIKDYGPCLTAGIWIMLAIVKPSAYSIITAGVVTLLSLTVWLEWHKEVFK